MSPLTRAVAAGVLLVGTTAYSHAADIYDANIFNPSGVGAAAVSSSTYGGDLASFAVDRGIYYSQFFFADFAGNESLSLSGFSAPTGISTLRFFDAETFEEGRVATSVTIYASSTNYASNPTAALISSNYSVLNGGTPFTLQIGAGTDSAYYNTGVATSGGNQYYGHYFDLPISIPAGTQSLLFDFGSPGIGKGFTEIQGFAPSDVPEPSTYAMMAAGLVLLGFYVRRKLATSL